MHCIIPCRGGSKRIPRKAIELVEGKPMLINSIEKAKSLDFIDKVFVSTDDDQFGSLAKKNGAIYLSRTKELSDDFIGVGETLAYVAKKLLNDKFVKETDFIVTLFPCTPLLTIDSINNFCREFFQSKCKSGLVVSKYRHPIQRSLSRNKDGYISIDDFEQFNKRTQDLEEKYHDAGQCYISETSVLINGDTIDDNPYGYIDNSVIDIDNFSDLEYARKLIKIK